MVPPALKVDLAEAQGAANGIELGNVASQKPSVKANTTLVAKEIGARALVVEPPLELAPHRVEVLDCAAVGAVGPKRLQQALAGELSAAGEHEKRKERLRFLPTERLHVDLLLTDTHVEPAEEPHVKDRSRASRRTRRPRADRAGLITIARGALTFGPRALLSKRITPVSCTFCEADSLYGARRRKRVGSGRESRR